MGHALAPTGGSPATPASSLDTMPMSRPMPRSRALRANHSILPATHTSLRAQPLPSIAVRRAGVASPRVAPPAPVPHVSLVRPLLRPNVPSVIAPARTPLPASPAPPVSHARPRSSSATPRPMTSHAAVHMHPLPLHSQGASAHIAAASRAPISSSSPEAPLPPSAPRKAANGSRVTPHSFVSAHASASMLSSASPAYTHVRTAASPSAASVARKPVGSAGPAATPVPAVRSRVPMTASATTEVTAITTTPTRPASQEMAHRTAMEVGPTGACLHPTVPHTPPVPNGSPSSLAVPAPHSSSSVSRLPPSVVPRNPEATSPAPATASTDTDAPSSPRSVNRFAAIFRPSRDQPVALRALDDLLRPYMPGSSTTAPLAPPAAAASEVSVAPFASRQLQPPPAPSPPPSPAARSGGPPTPPSTSSAFASLLQSHSSTEAAASRRAGDEMADWGVRPPSSSLSRGTTATRRPSAHATLHGAPPSAPSPSSRGSLFQSSPLPPPTHAAASSTTTTHRSSVSHNTGSSAPPHATRVSPAPLPARDPATHFAPFTQAASYFVEPQHHPVRATATPACGSPLARPHAGRTTAAAVGPWCAGAPLDTLSDVDIEAESDGNDEPGLVGVDDLIDRLHEIRARRRALRMPTGEPVVSADSADSMPSSAPTPAQSRAIALGSRSASSSAAASSSSSSPSASLSSSISSARPLPHRDSGGTGGGEGTSEEALASNVRSTPHRPDESLLHRNVCCDC